MRPPAQFVDHLRNKEFSYRTVHRSIRFGVHFNALQVQVGLVCDKQSGYPTAAYKAKEKRYYFEKSLVRFFTKSGKTLA